MFVAIPCFNLVFINQKQSAQPLNHVKKGEKEKKPTSLSNETQGLSLAGSDFFSLHSVVNSQFLSGSNLPRFLIFLKLSEFSPTKKD